MDKHVVKRHVVVGAKSGDLRPRLAERFAQSAIKRLKHVEILYIHILFVGYHVSKHSLLLCYILKYVN